MMQNKLIAATVAAGALCAGIGLAAPAAADSQSSVGCSPCNRVSSTGPGKKSSSAAPVPVLGDSDSRETVADKLSNLPGGTAQKWVDFPGATAEKWANFPGDTAQKWATFPLETAAKWAGLGGLTKAAKKLGLG